MANMFLCQCFQEDYERPLMVFEVVLSLSYKNFRRQSTARSLLTYVNILCFATLYWTLNSQAFDFFTFLKAELFQLSEMKFVKENIVLKLYNYKILNFILVIIYVSYYSMNIYFADNTLLLIDLNYEPLPTSKHLYNFF